LAGLNKEGSVDMLRFLRFRRFSNGKSRARKTNGW